MKLSSVALSAAALALTASAATIVPSTVDIKADPQHQGSASDETSQHHRKAKGQGSHDRSDEHRDTDYERTETHSRGASPRLLRRASTWEKISKGDMSSHHKRRLPSRGTSHQQHLTRSDRLRARYQQKREESTGEKDSDSSSEIPQTQSGVPGFVEVAVPVLKSGLAKTVSGLAYSMNPSSSGSGFELGTSPSQSTQFFLSPIKTATGHALFQLRVPILDSSSLETVDHCATFAISPPGPLSLQKCGSSPGNSQTFSYDSGSGELQPIYGQSTPALISTSGRSVVPLQRYEVKQPSMDNSASPSSNSDDNAQERPATNETQLAESNSTQASASTNPNSTPVAKRALPLTPSASSSSTSPASVVLYFVPADGFYKAPTTIEQIMGPASSSPTMRNTANFTINGTESDHANVPMNSTDLSPAKNVTREVTSPSQNETHPMVYTDLPSVNVSAAILAQVAAIVGADNSTATPISRSIESSTNATDPSTSANPAPDATQTSPNSTTPIDEASPITSPSNQTINS